MTWLLLGGLLLGVLLLVALWALLVMSAKEQDRALEEWAGRVGVTVRHPDDEEDWT